MEFMNLWKDVGGFLVNGGAKEGNIQLRFSLQLADAEDRSP